MTRLLSHLLRRMNLFRFKDNESIVCSCFVAKRRGERVLSFVNTCSSIDMKSKSSNLDQVSSKEHELGIVCSDDNSTIEGIIR